ncbi:MAG: hypothetical protein ABUS79_28760, partial [Pseudomonadota bacterium]
AHFVAGERAAAETLSRILVAADDHDVRSLALLARIAFMGGEPVAGLGWLRRALDADPADSEARALLTQVEGKSGRAEVITPAGAVRATGS